MVRWAEFTPPYLGLSGDGMTRRIRDHPNTIYALLYSDSWNDRHFRLRLHRKILGHVSQASKLHRVYLWVCQRKVTDADMFAIGFPVLECEVSCGRNEG